MEPAKDDKASGTSNSKKTFPPLELRRKRRTPSERRSWEDRAVWQELGSQRSVARWQWRDKEGEGTKYSSPSPFLPLVFCFHWPNPTNEAGRLGSRSVGQPTEAQRRAEECIAGRGGCSGQMQTTSTG